MSDNSLDSVAREQAVLRARARALARPADRASPDAHSIDVVEFSLAQERYALEVQYVGGVEPLRNLAPLPCTPPFVSGLVSVRGRLVPVLDLKKFFDLPAPGLTDLHVVILVVHRDLEFGVLADAVLGVSSVRVDDLHPGLPTLTEVGTDYLKGVTPEHVIVLDAARIAADPGIIVDEDIRD